MRREVGHRPATLGRDTAPDIAADWVNDDRHREGAAQDASADQALRSIRCRASHRLVWVLRSADAATSSRTDRAG